MPRGVKKENLPSKVCVICNRPFTWRKKWEKVWDEVTTCSKSCNHKRRARQQEQNRQENRKNIGLDGGVLEQSSVSTLNSMASQASQETVGSPGDRNSENVDDMALSSASLQNELALLSLMEGDGTNGKTSGEEGFESEEEAILDPKAARKAAKKRAKALRRAQREGRADPSVGRKQCDLCGKPVDLLIRCTIDQSAEWKMVCGKCWHTVSGGVVDGSDKHPHYRYGGLWKNRAKR